MRYPPFPTPDDFIHPDFIHPPPDCFWHEFLSEEVKDNWETLDITIRGLLARQAEWLALLQLIRDSQ